MNAAELAVQYGVAGALLIALLWFLRHLRYLQELDDNRRKADQKAARDLADSCHSSHQATTVTLTQTVERTNEALDRNTAAHSQCGEVLRDVRGELRSRPSP